MSKNKVFCFGEILLHYAPPVAANYIDSHQMPFYLGGAELNVATALANWDIPVKYGTVMPSHFLTDQIIAHLSKKNMDTSKIEEILHDKKNIVENNMQKWYQETSLE